jgi:hypothetical protein
LIASDREIRSEYRGEHAEHDSDKGRDDGSLGDIETSSLMLLPAATIIRLRHGSAG